MPELRLEKPPTEAEVADFAQAQADDINAGVFRLDGSRLPPQFDHHVDDCGFADVDEFVEQGVYASALALYAILGFPSAVVPDHLSKDKLVALYGFLRKYVGRQWNTRRLVIGMPPYKRLELIERLEHWIAQQSFTLVEAAEIQGILENHTRCVKWARVWFLAIQADFRQRFGKLFFIAERRYKAMNSATRKRYERELPQSLWSRIDQLMARDRAQLLWNMRMRSQMSCWAKGALRRTDPFLFAG